MIRRRWMRWGAVGAAAAVALTGCVGEDEPELSPSRTPEPTLSDAELVGATETAYQGFLNELSEMYAQFDSDYTRLTPFATSELATSAVSSMEQTHAAGLNIEGAPVIVAVELVERAPSSVVAVCLDGSDGRVYDIESGVELPPSSESPLTAWTLVVEEDDAAVVVDSRDPIPDGEPTPCDSVT